MTLLVELEIQSISLLSSTGLKEGVGFFFCFLISITTLCLLRFPLAELEKALEFGKLQQAHIDMAQVRRHHLLTHPLTLLFHERVGEREESKSSENHSSAVISILWYGFLPPLSIHQSSQRHTRAVREESEPLHERTVNRDYLRPGGPGEVVLPGQAARDAEKSSFFASLATGAAGRDYLDEAPVDEFGFRLPCPGETATDVALRMVSRQPFSLSDHHPSLPFLHSMHSSCHPLAHSSIPPACLSRHTSSQQLNSHLMQSSVAEFSERIGKLTTERIQYLADFNEKHYGETDFRDRQAEIIAETARLQDSLVQDLARMQAAFTATCQPTATQQQEQESEGN